MPFARRRGARWAGPISSGWRHRRRGPGSRHVSRPGSAHALRARRVERRVHGGGRDEPELHPGTTHPSISINKITDVEVRVDGAGCDRHAAATAAQSRFTAQLPAVAAGAHHVEVRAFDDFGNRDRRPEPRRRHGGAACGARRSGPRRTHRHGRPRRELGSVRRSDALPRLSPEQPSSAGESRRGNARRLGSHGRLDRLLPGRPRRSPAAASGRTRILR